MSSGAWLGIDLLRQRREQFGHQPPQSIPVRMLLLRGSLLGATLPVLLLLICGWLLFRERSLIQAEKGLAPVARRHDFLQEKIASEQEELKSLVNTNKAMALAMADVRSSSALLSELQRLVPAKISFSQVKVNGNLLELDGEALQPNGLRVVNALMLSLGDSVLFQSDEVVLKKVQVKQSGRGDRAASELVTYSLTAAFSPDAPQAIRSQLASLGALGFEKRMQFLQQEGLLP